MLYCVVEAIRKANLFAYELFVLSVNCAHGVVVPIPTELAKYATPVVVAPPEIVRPPICVPEPIVVDASESNPPESVESPVTPSVDENDPVPPVSAPMVAALEKRLVDDAVVEKIDVVVAPVATILPNVCRPLHVFRSAKRVDDAAVPLN